MDQCLVGLELFPITACRTGRQMSVSCGRKKRRRTAAYVEEGTRFMRGGGPPQVGGGAAADVRGPQKAKPFGVASGVPKRRSLLGWCPGSPKGEAFWGVPGSWRPDR